MSFELICPNCGAPSSPSVGVCPFCKTILTSKKHSKDSPTITNINKLYSEGKLEQALLMVKSAENKKPNLLNNVRFILLYVKILIEVDGPSSKIRERQDLETFCERFARWAGRRRERCTIWNLNFLSEKSNKYKKENKKIMYLDILCPDATPLTTL